MCQYCRMTITDLRYTGEIIERKKIHKFDDIGCMLAYAQTHNLDTNNASFWVMDFDNQSWVEAGKASFVLSPGIKTPMAHGIIAFKEPVKAKGAADRFKGEAMQFQTLFNMDWKAGHAH
jgi:copper chaperone NosL